MSDIEKRVCQGVPAVTGAAADVNKHVSGAGHSKSLPIAVQEPDDTEKRAIAAAKQAIAEMPPRFDIGTQIKTENGVTQIIEGPRHSDMDGWRAQLMAAFGTTSAFCLDVQ